MSTEDQADIQKRPEAALQDSRQSRKRARGWIIVLLLLLLLLTCVFMQLLFPSRRGPLVTTPAEGLVPVFSIYGLNEPRGVASLPDGRVLISDTGAQRAYIYDSNGVLVTRLGGELPANRVFSVTGSMYQDGVAYICDWGLRRVWMFAEDGSVIGHFPEDPLASVYGEGGFFPYDIDRMGDEYLVATRTGVFRFDQAGALIGRFDRGEVDGFAPRHITGLEVDPHGEYVWVADSFNRRVIAYDRSGNPVWSLGRPDVDGEIVSFFGLPRDVAYTDRGLLVADAFRHELYLFDRAGSLIGVYGRRGTADAEFNFPESISIAYDGLLNVADRANDRVQVLRLGDPLVPGSELVEKWKQGITRYE
ncbi:MAG: NHL repeat-containing protein [Clostridiales bacterium]|nr:NHL repeat-containing protein [Clostridiales bacterium]